MTPNDNGYWCVATLAPPPLSSISLLRVHRVGTIGMRSQKAADEESNYLRTR